MNTKPFITIEPRGSYFETDEQGYIINPASVSKIQDKYKPLINDIIELYKTTFGEHLTHVYLRGSVAKGQAVDGVSDIDTFAYVNQDNEYLQAHNTKRADRIHLEETYPFVEEIEMMATPLDEYMDDHIILLQSVCVYGTPIQVPPMKPGKNMAIHAPYFHKRTQWFENFSKSNPSEELIKNKCVWLMKALLRTGFEITMERSQKYTRDLYRCFETFSQYYPEQEPHMKEVLSLALNPTSDLSVIQTVMNTFGVWLIDEIPKYFEIK